MYLLDPQRSLRLDKRGFVHGTNGWSLYLLTPILWDLVRFSILRFDAIGGSALSSRVQRYSPINCGSNMHDESVMIGPCRWSVDFSGS